MGHTSDSEPAKRKRDVDDAGGQGRAQHAPTSLQQGVPGYIHYLPRSNASHLSLVQGDADTFADIIGLIGEYETVLDRHESLAASLGAKLTGPRLLRGIEKFFDGPIKTTPLQPFSNPISWLDVVSFARSNPKDFTLVQKADGTRCCQFVLKGSQVEIMEDDWRLVWSGALDRFPLDHPLEEDETAELATLDILEQRTSILYKKADEVAARARILNHRLGQRKQDIRRRRSTQDTPPSRYQPTNSTGSSSSHRTANFSAGYDLHADLLQQFLAASASPPPSRSTSVTGIPITTLSQPSPSHSVTHSQAHGPRYSGHAAETTVQPVMDSRETAFRSLITQRTDQLGKGDHAQDVRKSMQNAVGKQSQMMSFDNSSETWVSGMKWILMGTQTVDEFLTHWTPKTGIQVDLERGKKQAERLGIEHREHTYNGAVDCVDASIRSKCRTTSAPFWYGAISPVGSRQPFGRDFRTWIKCHGVGEFAGSTFEHQNSPVGVLRMKVPCRLVRVNTWKWFDKEE
ncbi:uncharacterized protein FTJAE_7902 [Fusarium tjaetaba]|uniref:Uncharacterized protein n=1 Tax=Fusarium tjaetaba TaxID=1567544 RepID=A0A8H5VQZ3_9HYPO|nr:uncharacterized protein FTJAE_7902 [Fusarium tjaetaba]KAF5631340.1 hypothetical protein FTJAE_7902 [Fusarium tjaetaba]